MRKTLSLLLCLLFVALPLTACGGGGGSTPTTADTTDAIYGSISASVSGSASASLSASATTQPSSSQSPDPGTPPATVAVDLGANAYLLIHPEGASTSITGAVGDLFSAMQSKSLAEAGSVKDDWIKRGTEAPAYEILCGSCDRPELAALLATPMRVNDYVIEVSGTKLILLGGSDSATAAAIRRFKTDYIDAGVSTFADGTLASFADTYPVMDFKIGDNDISTYKILHATDDYSKSIAMELQAQLTAMTGYALPLLSGAQAASTEIATEILVGQTTRNLTNSLTARQYQFSIRSGKVHLEVGSPAAIGYVVNAFLSDIQSRKSGTSVQYNATLAGTTQTIPTAQPLCSYANGSDLRLMSYNVLGGTAAEVNARQTYLRAFLSDYLPDVIGMQECESDQRNTLIPYLKNNGYTLATVSSGDGAATPILYRTSRFTKVASGATMLRSRYKGTGTKSIAWVVLKDKTTGKQFALINTHFSILSSYTNAQLKQYNGLTSAQLTDIGRVQIELEWRLDNAKQAVEVLTTLRKNYGATLPVFLMGDLNTTETSEPFKILTDGGMKNCKSLTENRDTSGSTHELGSTVAGGNPIDHILVTNGSADVFLHDIVRDDNTKNGSDHFPVFCDVKIK